MPRRIVVTGSASGIGAAVATTLREGGDEVIGVDRAGAEVIADLSTAAGRAAAIAGIRAAGDGARALDVVIACAGIADGVPAAVAVNYFGVVELLVGLRPLMTSSAAPRAVAVSSVASLMGADDALLDLLLAGDEAAALARGEQLTDSGVGFLNYATSKRALSRWIRRMAVTADWAGAGIALNAVAPGTVLTPMTAPLLADPGMAELVDQSVPMPYGGHQSAQTIADALIWLTREDNTHLTGQTIFVDGGCEAVLRAGDPWP